MAVQTITLHQYNQRQKPKNKALTKRRKTFEAAQCRVITRKVLGKGITQFMVPADLSPGLALRLVDMMKWNIEVDAGYHKAEKGSQPEKYTDTEFEVAVWSLACLDNPDLYDLVEKVA
jgi:hypothetical protein